MNTSRKSDESPRARMCIDCGVSIADRGGTAKRCAACAVVYRKGHLKEYRKENAENIAAWQAEYYRKNAEMIAVVQAEYARKNAEKIAARVAKYRKENAEKIAARMAEYRKENAEKIAAGQAEHYRKNAERIAARHAEHYRKNVEKIAARMAEYYRENTERIAVRQAEYNKKNPEKITAKAQRRLTKVQETCDGTVTEEFIRLSILGAPCCIYCLASGVKLTLDHFIPLSKGGIHTASNCVPACKHCNSSKGAKDVKTWMVAKFGDQLTPAHANGNDTDLRRLG